MQTCNFAQSRTSSKQRLKEFNNVNLGPLKKPFCNGETATQVYLFDLFPTGTRPARKCQTADRKAECGYAGTSTRDQTAGARAPRKADLQYTDDTAPENFEDTLIRTRGMCEKLLESSPFSHVQRCRMTHLHSHQKETSFLSSHCSCNAAQAARTRLAAHEAPDQRLRDCPADCGEPAVQQLGNFTV